MGFLFQFFGGGGKVRILTKKDLESTAIHPTMPLKRKRALIASAKPRSERGLFVRTQLPIPGNPKDGLITNEKERDSTYSPSVESDGTSDDSAYSDEVEISEKGTYEISLVSVWYVIRKIIY